MKGRRERYQQILEMDCTKIFILLFSNFCWDYNMLRYLLHSFPSSKSPIYLHWFKTSQLFLSFTLLVTLIDLLVGWLGLWECICTCQSAHRDQRAHFRIWFLPPMWLLGIKHRLPALEVNVFTCCAVLMAHPI